MNLKWSLLRISDETSGRIQEGTYEGILSKHPKESHEKLFGNPVRNSRRSRGRNSLVNREGYLGGFPE